MRVIFRGPAVETFSRSPEDVIADAEELCPREAWAGRKQLGIITYATGHHVSIDITDAGNLSIYVGADWR